MLSHKSYACFVDLGKNIIILSRKWLDLVMQKKIIPVVLVRIVMNPFNAAKTGV